MLLIPTLRVPERIALFVDWRLVRKAGISPGRRSARSRDKVKG